MTISNPMHAPHLWATPTDALKLILTGHVIGNLSSNQLSIYSSILARIENYTAAAKPRKKVLPGVRIEECVNELKDHLEILCYIPDLVAFMFSVFDDWSLSSPPLDLDYLNSLTDEFSKHLFMFGAAPGHEKWQYSQEGQAHWSLVSRKLDLKRDMKELGKTHHANDPSKLESRRRVRKELQEELSEVKLALNSYKTPIKQSSLPTSKPSSWHEHARILGQRYIKEFPHLSIEQIAKKVHETMADQHITGRGDKVPTAGTIKRHALVRLSK